MTDATLEPPRKIGPYRVLQSIARGGSGQVFEVEDPNTGEHLALKLLMNENASFARFYREYEAMSRLNHPNIIRVYHFGIFGSMPWQTMELVTGTPVQPYVMRRGRPGDPRRIDEAIRLGHDIAGALHHIHRRGLVHRDLKSANLLVLPDGRIKLIDFGSTRVLDGQPLTREGDFVGTFAYAAPEQLMGQKVDGRADLYSLGVLLYRLCTGRRPFEHDDPHELARMHVYETPVAPRELFPSIPEPLDALILQLLAKRADDRPRSGKRVARALEDLAGRPLVLPGTLEIEDSANRLVGREAQLAALHGFIERAGPGTLALLHGMEGAGRTTLLQTVGNEARREGWLVYRCVLSPGKDLLGIVLALRQVLDALPDPNNATVQRARALLDTVSKSWDLRSAARREAFQQAGTILLRAATTQAARPLLFIIEGLHYARPVALEWLAEVKTILGRTDTAVLFAAGVDPILDRGHLPARERFADDLQIHLAPLDAHQVGLLVGALLHRRPPPPVLAHRIYEASGGLPVYVEDVVRNLVDEGLLKERGRDPNRLEWTHHQDLRIPIPVPAREAVLAAYAPLPQLHRRLLETLALLDQEATPRDLAAGMGWFPDEIEPVLDALRDGGWLEPPSDDPDGPVRWRQHLARSVVREQCDPSRRFVLYSLLKRASILARPSVAQVELLVASGQIDGAVRSAASQAEEHLSRGRPYSAIEVLEPIVSQGARMSAVPTEDIARLYLAHARAIASVRPLDPILATSIKRAATLGRGDGFNAEVELTRAMLARRIGHLAKYREHLSAAWTHAREADRSAPICVRIAIEFGISHLQTGDLPRAHRWLSSAAKTAQENDDLHLSALAEAGMAHHRHARGEFQSAQAGALAAIQVFRKSVDAEGLALALPVYADVLRHQGRFSEGIKLLSEVLPALRRQEDPSPYVTVLVALAWLEVEIGRLGRAQECIDELAATVSSGEMLALRLQARLVWGRILVESDQLRQAAVVLGEVCNLASSAQLAIVAEHARGLLAEALWLGGKTDEARALYHQALERIINIGDQPTLVEVCRSRGRVAARYVDPDELFAPIRDLLAREPAELARMDWLVATGHHLGEVSGDTRGVWLRARHLLRELAGQLTEIDRSALRVHAWARHIRQNLDDPDTVVP